jgi:hypothetical protein
VILFKDLLLLRLDRLLVLSNLLRINWLVKVG